MAPLLPVALLSLAVGTSSQDGGEAWRVERRDEGCVVQFAGGTAGDQPAALELLREPGDDLWLMFRSAAWPARAEERFDFHLLVDGGSPENFNDLVGYWRLHPSGEGWLTLIVGGELPRDIVAALEREEELALYQGMEPLASFDLGEGKTALETLDRCATDPSPRSPPATE